MNQYLAAKSEKSSAFLLEEILKKISPIMGIDAEKRFSIFLCGAKSSDKTSVRDSVRKRIESSTSKYVYQVFYPELLFEEILRGHHKADLLSLENLLADSVDLVAVIVESPGAIAELGAFTNHEQLKDKMAVFIDKKYKNDRSFINLGPLDFLRKNTGSQVFFTDFETDVPVIVDLTRRATRDRAQILRPTKGYHNPVLSILPLLVLIGVTQPISRESIEKALLAHTGGDQQTQVTIQVVLNFLSSTQLTRNQSGILSLAINGRKLLRNPTNNVASNTKINSLAQKLRILYLYKSNHISR